MVFQVVIDLFIIYHGRMHFAFIVKKRTGKEDENLKKIWETIAKDLWVALADIIAVNAAYYLALLIRFFDGRKGVECFA